MNDFIKISKFVRKGLGEIDKHEFSISIDMIATSITFISTTGVASIPIDQLPWIKGCLDEFEVEMAKENT